MEWRRQIEKQRPMAGPNRDRRSCGEDVIKSAEYRVAAGNPDHIEHLLRAASERERIRREA